MYVHILASPHQVKIYNKKAIAPGDELGAGVIGNKQRSPFSHWLDISNGPMRERFDDKFGVWLNT